MEVRRTAEARGTTAGTGFVALANHDTMHWQHRRTSERRFRQTKQTPIFGDNAIASSSSSSTTKAVNAKRAKVNTDEALRITRGYGIGRGGKGDKVRGFRMGNLVRGSLQTLLWTGFRCH